MSVFSGDFLGFTLGDVHSSQLNITRVSVSDRYEDNLLANFKDTTVEVPGGDGMYYWNTFYSQKPFTIHVAYDDLRDEDLRRLRQIFSFKGIKPLIFDETSYKKYMVKCVSPPIFKYICFDYKEVKLYKGEGTINLMAYYPYALATFSSVITSSTEGIISNVGDLEAEIKIYYSISNALQLSSIKLETFYNEQQLGIMNFNNLIRQNDDSYIVINSKTHLIEGLDENFNKTGNLYNKFLTTGDFFNGPVGLSRIVSNVPFEKIEYTPLYY